MIRVILLAPVILFVVACAGAGEPTAPSSSVNDWKWAEFPSTVSNSSTTHVQTSEYVISCHEREGRAPESMLSIIMEEPMSEMPGDPVPAHTTVSGIVCVDWSTWSTKPNRIGLMDEAADTLVTAMDNGEEVVVLEFADKPKFSGDFDMSGLVDTIEESGMPCFN